ncbi:hypothetical protein GCM10023259_094260 [Thermocatellispora tengchongensis]
MIADATQDVVIRVRSSLAVMVAREVKNPVVADLIRGWALPRSAVEEAAVALDGTPLTDEEWSLISGSPAYCPVSGDESGCC